MNVTLNLKFEFKLLLVIKIKTKYTWTLTKSFLSGITNTVRQERANNNTIKNTPNQKKSYSRHLSNKYHVEIIILPY